MPTRSQSIKITYTALNTATLLGQLDDAANHTLYWFRDGVPATPVNAPTDTSVQGECALILTSDEADCATGKLTGISSTNSVIIVPVLIEFDGQVVFNGANACTVTVTDSSTSAPIPNALVRVTQGALTQVYQTDSGGAVAPALDNGDYTLVVTKGLDYIGQTVSFTVDSSHTTKDVALVINVIPAPISPSGCVVTFALVKGGSPFTNQVVTFVCVSPPTGVGQIQIDDIRTATSNSSTGIVSIELPQGSIWKILSTSPPPNLMIPASTSYSPPNVNIRGSLM